MLKTPDLELEPSSSEISEIQFRTAPELDVDEVAEDLRTFARHERTSERTCDRDCSWSGIVVCCKYHQDQNPPAWTGSGIKALPEKDFSLTRRPSTAVGLRRSPSEKGKRATGKLLKNYRGFSEEDKKDCWITKLIYSGMISPLLR